MNRLRRYSAEIPAAFIARSETGLAPLLGNAPSDLRYVSAAWLGHASILLRLGSRWILTDPVFSQRIGIPIGPVTIGLSRMLPSVAITDLPPIDLVLVSHAHFDHLDKPTLRRLATPGTRVITARGTGRLIPRGFGQVDELGWDKTIEAAGLTLRALRPRHWGARLTVDSHREYNSYVLDANQRRILFAGDTALTDRFASLANESKRIDLSIFGIGAYDPWIHNHASPEQVWSMFEQSGAKYLMPMHHSTFKLSDEPTQEPMQRLLAAAGGQSDRIVARDLGRLWTLPEED
jgi:L-ascorbate metabolism protein UlaG (beta-lactamase superfamily)